MKPILLGLAALAIAGCSITGPERGKPALLTELPRALTADEILASRAGNQFAFSLFKRLNAQQSAENVFVSPLSVSFALGMTMNGANGTTLDEMRTTLGFGASELAAINAGYKGLMSLEAGLDPSTTFEIANSVWYRQGFPVLPTFEETVRQTFDAEVRASPFDDGTVQEVNDWVSAKTNGKIATVLEPPIDPALVMFLINAIYFKGSWREQFDPARTRDAPFASSTGAQQVRMMSRPAKAGTIRFAQTSDATIGEMPYGNGAFVMTIVVPDDVNALVASLDTAAWSALLAPLQEHDYKVELPRFKLEYERTLNDDLEALGMNVPFIPDGADFTRMSPMGRQMYIDFVKHKTFVDVNEEGTEAAAVTTVGVGVTSLPPCLCADRPFVFAIRERFSGTILFMGKIVRIPPA